MITDAPHITEEDTHEEAVQKIEVLFQTLTEVLPVVQVPDNTAQHRPVYQD